MKLVVQFLPSFEEDSGRKMVWFECTGERLPATAHNNEKMICKFPELHFPNQWVVLRRLWRVSEEGTNFSFPEKTNCLRENLSERYFSEKLA